MHWIIQVGLGVVVGLVLISYIVLELKDLARRDRLDRSKGINPNRRRR